MTNDELLTLKVYRKQWEDLKTYLTELLDIEVNSETLDLIDEMLINMDEMLIKKKINEKINYDQR